MDDTYVTDSLRVIAGFSRSKSAHLVVLNQDWRRGRCVYSWPKKKTASLVHLDFWMQSGWWVRKLRTEGFVRFNDFSSLPLDVRNDLERLREEAIYAICLISIFEGKRLAGILQLDNPSVDRPIYQADLALLRTAASTILQTILASIDEERAKEWPVFAPQLSHAKERGSRSLFIQELQDIFRHKGCLFSIILLELDGFPGLEDEYWTSSVEGIHQLAFERVRASLRRSDRVIGLDKNTVGILLVDMFEREQAQSVAKRILRIVRNPYRVHGEEIEMAACAGVAYPHPGKVDFEDLLHQAEQALLQSKQQLDTMSEMVG